MNNFCTTNGKTLIALSVSSHKAQGVSTLNQLEDYGLLRPTVVEKANVRTDPSMQSAKQIRAELNRSFKSDKARRTNAEDFSAYIENTEVNGHTGGTPAITLYHETQLITDEDGNLLVPYSAVLVAIDGETQTEARYILRERLSETGNIPLAFTIYHGIPYEEAKQILHDYNAYGKRVPENILSNFNTSGPLTIAINDALSKAAIDSSRVNRKGTKAGPKAVISTRQLLVAATAFQRSGLALNSTVSAAHMLRLNNPAAAPLPPEGVDMLVSMAQHAAQDPALGEMPLLVWQVAGAKVAAGANDKGFDWAAAMRAFNDTKTLGKGGPRPAVKDRLVVIAAAM